MRLLLALLLVCLVMMNVATGVFYSQAKKRVRAIQESRIKDQHVQAASSQITATKKQLALLGDKPDELKRRLPTSDSVNDFFSYVNTLDGKYGVSHTFSFSSAQSGGAATGNTGGAPTPATGTTASQDITLSLTVSGSSLDSVLNFINDLESGAYIITVKQVTATTVSDPASARATVDFVLYVSEVKS